MYDALIKMREVNSYCKLIYIGEYKGGCTASDKFFDAVQFLNYMIILVML